MKSMRYHRNFLKILLKMEKKEKETGLNLEAGTWVLPQKSKSGGCFERLCYGEKREQEEKK